MVDEQKLRALADQCICHPVSRSIEEIEAAGEAIKSLLEELQTLRSERTAWRVTAENAEAELKLINEMNDQLREQNTAVDEACARLEAAVKQARIDALEEAARMVFDTGPKELPLALVTHGFVAAIESLKGQTP